MRPVYCLNRGTPLISKLSPVLLEEYDLATLVSKGYITYIDTQQQLNCFLAPTYSDLTPQSDYLYVSPDSNISFLGNLLPLVSNNAAHRGSLSLRLLDQALGGRKDKSTFKYKETKAEYLLNADLSMLSTSLEEKLEERIGQNVVLCLQSQETEEDSLTMNDFALQRGLMHSILQKRVSQEFKISDGHYSYRVSDKMERPIPVLEKDHLPAVDSLVQEEPIMALAGEESGSNVQHYRKVRSPNNRSYISQIKVGTTTPDVGSVDFIFSKLNKVSVGDKLGTRNGLKGVVSKTVSQLDLLIPENGVNPSVYASNHTINSRMILGTLIEAFLSKAAASNGIVTRAAIFVNRKADDDNLNKMINEARALLKKENLDPAGFDNLYCVQTFRVTK